MQIRRQIQADSVVSCPNGFINFLSLVLRHEERDTILQSLSKSFYANSTPNVRHISWFLRSQFISAGRDPKNSTLRLNGRIPTLCLNGRNSTFCFHGPISTSTDSFSKSSNSPNNLFRAWRHPHSSPISCLGVYYDNGDCDTLCVWA